MIKELFWGFMVFLSILLCGPVIVFLPALLVMPADGKNFYEIISSLELILRFAGCFIGMAFLLVLYVRFVFLILINKLLRAT